MIIYFFLLLFFPVLFFVPVSTAASMEWAVYTNVSHGYRLNYPFAWKINSEDPKHVRIANFDNKKAGDDIKILSVASGEPEPKDQAEIVIHVKTNEYQLSLEEFAESYDKCLDYEEGICTVISNEYVLLDLFPAAILRQYQLSGNNHQLGTYFYVDFSEDGTSRLISIDFDMALFSDKGSEELNTTLRQLVESFQIIAPGDYSGWNTLYDPKLRLNMLYPAGWDYHKTDDVLQISTTTGNPSILDVGYISSSSSRIQYWKNNLNDIKNYQYPYEHFYVTGLSGIIQAQDEALASLNGIPVLVLILDGETHSYEFLYKNLDTKNAKKVDLQDNLFYVKGVLKNITFFPGDQPLAIFSDVEDEMYREAIGFLYQGGVVAGYKDGSYKPLAGINRAEFLRILLDGKYGKISEEYAGKNCFVDVLANMWFTKYVCFAAEKGFVEGYEVDEGGRKFDPAREVNFVEGLKMVAQVYGLQYSQNGEVWYEDLVRQASTQQLIPADVTAFDIPLKRGQMAELMTRFIKKTSDELSTYLTHTSGPGYCGKTPRYEDIKKGRNVCS